MHQGKVVIGITPLWDTDRSSLWMLPGYWRGIEKFGAIPLVLPLTSDPAALEVYLTLCDGFLFTGGQDIDPRIYGESFSPACGEIASERDRMDWYLVTKAVASDKAVLGICRGLQLMNAVFGGSLYQDLPSEHPSELHHRMQAPYDRPAHDVSLVTDSPLERLVKSSTLAVNSCHHQGIKEIAPDFQAMAIATDGLCEAIWMPEKPFVWAVQWHPEVDYEKRQESRDLFMRFIVAARGC